MMLRPDDPMAQSARALVASLRGFVRRIVRAAIQKVEGR